MKRLLVCCLLGGLLSGCAHARINDGLEFMSTGLLLADWAQTHQASDCFGKTCQEINPILGDDPSETRIDVYFATATVTHFGVNRWLSKKPLWWRTAYNLVIIAVEGACVVNNKNAGVVVRF